MSLLFRFLGLLPCIGVLATLGAEPESPLARFVGISACASSSCHGGAGPRRDQLSRWEARDVHRRAATTLNSARAEQVARALGIADSSGTSLAAASPRCTACHAPNATVSPARRLASLDPSEGVACESCHAPAESWLRSHTRSVLPGGEFTYVDKLADGLRDLRDLRVRANVCVACHENVERAVLEAGHPELIFELDGQTRHEPRHWIEKSVYHGAKAWLVGQAVAWREIAWLGGQPGEATDRRAAREAAVAWLVTRAARSVGIDATDPDPIARAAATRNWSDADTEAVLRAVAGTAAEFRAVAAPGTDAAGAKAREFQARRAERLVLALDRLVSALPESRGQSLTPPLDQLFRLAQSLPDFSPDRFAGALSEFAGKL